MEYYVTSKDDSLIDHVLDPANLSKVLYRGDAVFDELKRLQSWTDYHATMKLGQKIAGGTGDIKLIARFPEHVLIKLLELEPDLLKDKKNFNRIITKYPIYAAYTRKTTGGAS
jgi:hypothetical protein